LCTEDPCGILDLSRKEIAQVIDSSPVDPLSLDDILEIAQSIENAELVRVLVHHLPQENGGECK
jgi:hypothetical protein